jgi:two-component system, chemotaxis family, protein-glutamate methylesterase/glutaminase
MDLSNQRKIRVLIVDDSLIFREAILWEISKDSQIEVVATATDPYDARDKIIEFMPDVMTLDVEMPKLNGIDFLKKLMPQYPIPVVVVSGIRSSVFEALDAGAVDFVNKPDPTIDRSSISFIKELVVKIKIASTAKVGHYKHTNNKQENIEKVQGNINNKIIALGASTGGTEATLDLLKNLPKSTPGMVIVQHMPPVFTKMYAERLNNNCLLEVKEAKTGDIILPGRVLIAPGDKHMKVMKKGTLYMVECFEGPKVSGHCPSVDVLFHSVAQQVGSNALGIILTGMGKDGAKGLLNMKSNGAKTIGQDKESCVVYGMSKIAYEMGAVDTEAPIDEMPSLIFSILNSMQ